MTTTRPDCNTCTYNDVVFDDDDGQPIAKCHRYPPTVLVIDGVVSQLRPDASSPCGEWQPVIPADDMTLAQRLAVSVAVERTRHGKWLDPSVTKLILELIPEAP